MITLLIIYIVSVIAVIIVTILMERVPEKKLTIGEVLGDGYLIFFPLINTLVIIIVVLALIADVITKVTVFRKMWKRFLNKKI
jgi:hypothetical protein